VASLAQARAHRFGPRQRPDDLHRRQHKNDDLQHAITATPNIYVNFFASDSPRYARQRRQLTAPLLYIAASNDPTQRGRGYIFDRAPANR
jgi:hypothetical protein